MASFMKRTPSFSASAAVLALGSSSSSSSKMVTTTANVATTVITSSPESCRQIRSASCTPSFPTSTAEAIAVALSVPASSSSLGMRSGSVSSRGRLETPFLPPEPLSLGETLGGSLFPRRGSSRPTTPEMAGTNAYVTDAIVEGNNTPLFRSISTSASIVVRRFGGVDPDVNQSAASICKQWHQFAH
ncbi:hypothetical protein BGZ94_000759 [Podila epigama]|nr:hypothetical protein BGZ94_000759 [Podila epigama]